MQIEFGTMLWIGKTYLAKITLGNLPTLKAVNFAKMSFTHFFKIRVLKAIQPRSSETILIPCVYCPFSNNHNFPLLEHLFIWSINLTFLFSKILISASKYFFINWSNIIIWFCSLFLKEVSLADLCFEDFIGEKIIYFNWASSLSFSKICF